MTEDFDLPRWQTQDSSSISSPTQHHPSAPYLQYPPGPPPAANQQQRLQALQQSPTGSNQSGGGSPTSRQPPRISQLLEQEQQQQSFAGSSPYSLSPQTSLNRSASLGGGATSSSRSRRHHQPDDLEGAFHSDSVSGLSSPRSTTGPSQLQASLYPSSVAYHQAQGGGAVGAGSSAASPATAEGTQAYSDMYYSGAQSQHTPKRSLTTHDSSTSSRGAAGRSPASNPSLADSYAQQSQYSPTTNASFSAPYPPPPPGSYHAHSRSHSQVKGEQPMTPPMASPYAPANNTLSPSYSDSHHSSPGPQARGNSVSTPNTPFPYPQTSQSPYYQQQEQMQVDAPQHKRRASGFKRVRDARDLRPVVNQQPAGRRMGADGAYLSVSVHDRLGKLVADTSLPDAEATNDQYHRYLPHL